MKSQDYFSEYSTVINLSEVYKAVGSFLSKNENQNIEELDQNLRIVLNDPDFNLWRYIDRNTPLNDDDLYYYNLLGFFKYFGVTDMERFLHNRTGQSLFEYLKKNAHSLRIFWDSSDLSTFDTVKFTCGNSKIYFHFQDGYYNSIDLKFFQNRCLLLNSKLLEIARIEKLINDEWIPVIINEKSQFFILERL